MLTIAGQGMFRNNRLARLVFLSGTFIWACVSLPAYATDKAHAEWLASVLGTAQAPSKILWLDKALKQELNDLLAYQPNGLRIRYWAVAGKTAWVLEEIGKELPITIGVAIDKTGVTSLKVLEYRESRGGEVQYPFFTEQFNRAHLIEAKPKLALDRKIDGITGATLSVRAMTKVVKAALYLHQKVSVPEATAGANAQQP